MRNHYRSVTMTYYAVLDNDLSIFIDCYLLNRDCTGSWICYSSLGAYWLVWGRALWLKEWKNLRGEMKVGSCGPSFWILDWPVELRSSPEIDVLWRLSTGISNYCPGSASRADYGIALAGSWGSCIIWASMGQTRSGVCRGLCKQRVSNIIKKRSEGDMVIISLNLCLP